MKLKLLAVPELSGHIVVLMSLTTLVMVASAYWDFWWHSNVGRNDFWIPPHVPIYVGLAITIGALTKSIVQNRFRINNVLGVALFSSMGFVMAAPFDDWWHRTYPVDEAGIHAITPPHALAVTCALFLGLAVSIMLNVYYSFNRESRIAKNLNFYYSAGGLSALTFPLIILDPYSADTVLGRIGSMTFALLIPAYLICNEMFYKERGLITKLALVSSVPRSVTTGNWVYALVNVVTALFVDFASDRMNNFRGFKYAVGGTVTFTSVSLALYYLLQNTLSGRINVDELLFRYAAASLFGFAGGALAYRANKIAMRVLKS